MLIAIFCSILLTVCTERWLTEYQFLITCKTLYEKVLVRSSLLVSISSLTYLFYMAKRSGIIIAVVVANHMFSLVLFIIKSENHIGSKGRRVFLFLHNNMDVILEFARLFFDNATRLVLKLLLSASFCNEFVHVPRT